MAKAP